jgi:hypothetical protein
MHVHRQCRGGREISEPALLAADVGERVPQSAELARDGHRQIARFPQLGEVLVEEPVFAIVARGALLEPLQHLAVSS